MYKITIGVFNDVVISYTGKDGGFEIRGDESYFEICSVSKNGAIGYECAFKTLFAAIRYGLEDILNLDNGYIDWLLNSDQEHSDALYYSWMRKKSTIVLTYGKG